MNISDEDSSKEPLILNISDEDSSKESLISNISDENSPKGPLILNTPFGLLSVSQAASNRILSIPKGKKPYTNADGFSTSQFFTKDRVGKRYLEIINNSNSNAIPSFSSDFEKKFFRTFYFLIDYEDLVKNPINRKITMTSLDGLKTEINNWGKELSAPNRQKVVDSFKNVSTVSTKPDQDVLNALVPASIEFAIVYEYFSHNFNANPHRATILREIDAILKKISST